MILLAQPNLNIRLAHMPEYTLSDVADQYGLGHTVGPGGGGGGGGGGQRKGVGGRGPYSKFCLLHRLGPTI